MKSFCIALLSVLAVAFRECKDEKPVDRTIAGANTSVGAFVDFFPEGQVSSVTMVQSVGELERQFGALKPGNEAGYNVKQFFVNGGNEAWITRLVGSNDAATIIGDSVTKTGLYSLDRVESFNLLCLPRLSDTSEATTLMRVAGAYCERRRAILVMDVPKNLSASNTIVEWASSLTFAGKRNVALYYPGITTLEQPAGMSLTGTVAGVIARVDLQAGVWKAPSGPAATLMNVNGFEREIFAQEATVLNDAGVNPLRYFPSGSRLIWGARTLSNDPEWKFLPVCRLALYIEESVFLGTRWATFEPKGEPLWAQVRIHVINFMQNLYVSGALMGSKPDEAYFVKCDKQTTTQEDLNNHVFNIQIGFAPMRRAEFVILNVRQQTAPLP